MGKRKRETFFFFRRLWLGLGRRWPWDYSGLCRMNSAVNIWRQTYSSYVSWVSGSPAVIKAGDCSQRANLFGYSSGRINCRLCPKTCIQEMDTFYVRRLLKYYQVEAKFCYVCFQSIKIIELSVFYPWTLSLFCVHPPWFCFNEEAFSSPY